MTSTEEWRPVPGRPMYDVSNQGRVRSWVPQRRQKISRRLTPKVLRPSPNRNGGHLKVTLGSRDRQYVHRLVAAAFLGSSPAGAVVRHLDDNPQNNVPSNLAYGTQADNGRDMVRNGGSPWANQTECWAGHRYTPESTYVTPLGRRRCRVCQRAHDQAYKARRRAGVAA